MLTESTTHTKHITIHLISRATNGEKSPLHLHGDRKLREHVQGHLAQFLVAAEPLVDVAIISKQLSSCIHSVGGYNTLQKLCMQGPYCLTHEYSLLLDVMSFLYSQKNTVAIRYTYCSLSPSGSLAAPATTGKSKCSMASSQ